MMELAQMSDKQFLEQVEKAMRNTPREGFMQQYITISDELALQIADRLKIIAERM